MTSTKRLNILFIAEEEHLGGGQVVIEELCNYMVRIGHRITLAQGTINNSAQVPYHRRLLDPRVKIYRYPVLSHSGLLKESYSLATNLWRLLYQLNRTTNFDIVFLNYAFSSLVACIHPTLKNKTKIYLFHGNEPKIGWSMIPKPRKHKVLGFIKRVVLAGPHIAKIYISQTIALELSSFVIASSKYSYQVLIRELGVTKRKLCQISFGVNHQVFTPPKNKGLAKENLGFSKDVNIVLCTSRFEPRKGIYSLLVAFTEILKNNPNTLLVLASPLDDFYLKSSYYWQLLKLIDKNSITRSVHKIFNLDRVQLTKYYQAADLYVFPSLDLETFGLVSLEALSCGVPVICYKNSGAPQETVSKISSDFIYKNPTPDDLADRINWYLSLGNDKKLKFERDSIDLSKKFSWEKTAKLLLELAVKE